MHRNGQESFQIDIKEIVHLSHDKLPIEEIQEMELVPQIDSREYGDQIEIEGCLYLFGDYKGNLESGRLDSAGELPESYEESVQFEPLSADRGPFSPLARQDRFEYRIPVRISLPREKVRNVEDVYAQINSFDYELKTPYQIEVVASLMISGLVNKEQEVENTRKLEEQFEFVHVASQGESHTPNQEQDFFSERLMAVEQQASSQEDRQEVTASFREFPPMKDPEPEQESFRAEAEEEERVEDTVEEVVEETVEEVRQENHAEQLDNVIHLPQVQEQEEERPALVEVQEEEEEIVEDVKVAISNKGTREEKESISSLSSFFASRAKKEESENQRSEPVTEAGRNTEETSEALYLTNFMENNADQFTKLKICILQKNETIDEVAERYQLSVETILRANQTARNQVAAGQLLYIPVKG